MKGLFLAILIVAFFIPLVSFASRTYHMDGIIVSFRGFVPCGKSAPAPAVIGQNGQIIEAAESNEVTTPCQLCHFFVMLMAIFDLILFFIAPVTAVLMFVIGGMMFLASGGNPATVSQAKGLLIGTVIGLVVIYSSWLAVNLFFSAIGVAQWTGLKEGWFSIICPIASPY